MSDDEMLQSLRTARDTLRHSLQAAIRQADMDDPDVLERLLQAQQQIEEADARLTIEEAKRPPMQGPRDRRRRPLS